MEKGRIIELLESSNDVQFKSACLDVLKSSGGFSTKAGHGPTDMKKQLEVLLKRKISSGFKNIEGMDNLVLVFQNSSEESFATIKISTDQETYSVYFTVNYKTILGIVRNTNIHQQKYLSLEKVYEEKGLSVSPKWTQY